MRYTVTTECIRVVIVQQNTSYFQLKLGIYNSEEHLAS